MCPGPSDSTLRATAPLFQPQSATTARPVAIASATNNAPSQAPPQPRTTIDYPPAPPCPMLWRWTCHKCGSKYCLGMTNRCLYDGHYYCSLNLSAAARDAASGSRRKQKSCTSEFDFDGWQDHGAYRRQCAAIKAFRETGDRFVLLRRCERCDSPSQCSYEDKKSIEVVNLSKHVSAELLASLTRPITAADVPASSTAGRFYSSPTSTSPTSLVPSSPLSHTSSVASNTGKPERPDHPMTSPLTSLHSDSTHQTSTISDSPSGSTTTSPRLAAGVQLTTSSRSDGRGSTSTAPTTTTTNRRTGSRFNTSIKRSSSQNLLADFIRQTSERKVRLNRDETVPIQIKGEAASDGQVDIEIKQDEGQGMTWTGLWRRRT